MSFTKSALLGSAAVLAVVAGAQAADLPSKKAAPATYVKICDAYGAGFFFIPGTETCVKLGGYVRYELQYTPAKATMKYDSTKGAVTAQSSNTQDTFGTEYRGRIDLDGRTPTAYGAVRTFISLRGTGTTGLRKATYDYSAGTVAPTLSATNGDLVMERAFVQWAGFTFGNASSNYAMIPSMTYTANGWAGFPNGQRQIAYTATFGGGLSATVALEDKQIWGNDSGNTNINLPDTPTSLVGNIRLDQAWGFAALHGVVGKHTLSNAADATLDAKSPQLAYAANPALTGTLVNGPVTKTGYGFGTTVSYNLDMLAKGDKIWLTANYENGWYGAILSSGSITSPSDGSSGGRTLGGAIRKDANVVFTGKNAAGVNTGFDTTTGWNVGAQLLHYWASNWRSLFTTAYAQVNPPTQAQTTAIAWGKGSIYEARGSLIYSPAKDFDIGVEVQYLKNNNSLQNTGTDTSAGNAAWKAAGYNGLNNSNFSTKFRVERTF